MELISSQIFTPKRPRTASESKVDKVNFTLEMHATLGRGVGQVLGEWSSFGELGGLGRSRVGPRVLRPKVQDPHVRVERNGAFRCNLCFKSLSRWVVSRSCTGLSPVIESVCTRPKTWP